MQDASKGIKFKGKTFDEALEKMVALTDDRGFANFIEFLQLLDLLSSSSETDFLASEGFTPGAQVGKQPHTDCLWLYFEKLL